LIAKSTHNDIITCSSLEVEQRIFLQIVIATRWRAIAVVVAADINIWAIDIQLGIKIRLASAN
jgi:hypothetical protein